MPFMSAQYDSHRLSMAAPADTSDAVFCSPSSSPHMFPRPPPLTAEPHLSSRAPPLTAAQHRAAAQFTVATVQQSTTTSAFFPYSNQPFSRPTQSPSLASATHLTSPNCSPVSASTASTASSTSSTASNSPQLHPSSVYPLSVFVAPLPTPHPLDLPPTVTAYGRHLSAVEVSEDEEDEECSPPDSPGLLPLECLEPSAADEEDDDTMDGGHAVTTPVTSLLAAARSFSTAPPVSSLVPSVYQPHSAHSNNHNHSHNHHHASHNGHRSSGGNDGIAHRISKACEACRRRKRKCDGVLPHCTSCQRVGGECRYPVQTRRRGPQAGMVQKLREQVSALESELHRERSRNSSAAAAAMAAGNIAEYANIGVLLVRDGGEQKALAYIKVYFDMLNSTLFPFLVQSHFEADYARHVSNPSTAPPVWHLTVGSVLAQGAGMSGDMEYSEQAALVARAAAAPLLDQPSSDVVRGLLLLSYHCLSCNQLSRVSCFLAVATRMCAIVDMSPEIPLLNRWLEDMLCAIRTWWRGLRTMPEGSYQKEQRERFPTDWARYERLSAYLKTNQKLPQYSSHPDSHLLSTSSVASLSLTGAPDPADLDDSNIRWEIMATLCALSEARGEYSKDTHLSVYHHLCVLSKAEYSPLTSSSVSTTVAFLKSQALFFVNEISTAIEYARVSTRNMLTHDVSHCAFTSLIAHFLAQVHLRTSDHAHLAIVLSMMRTCAERWKFADAPLRNVEQVIQQRLAPHSATEHEDEEVVPSDRDDFVPEHTLPQADRSKAEEYYQSSVIPQDELREKSRKRKLEREEAEAQSTSRQPPSPTMLSALRTAHTFPSLAETIAAFHPSFKTAFHVSVGVSRGAERVDDRPHTPSPSTSKRLALRQAGGELRADHPHPQLSTLKNSTFTLKREEIEAVGRAEPLTAALAEQSKPAASSRVRSPANPKAAVEAIAPTTPILPLPVTMTAASPVSYQASTSSALASSPSVADTYAWQAGLFSPAVTAISSNAYSAAFSSPHVIGYTPTPDQHTVQSYYPMPSGSYPSPGLRPFNYGRQGSLDSVASAPLMPYSYGFEAQPAMDASNSHYYPRSAMDMQLADDGSASRHAGLPSLSAAPPLQISHSTPVTASMYMPLPSPDINQSPYAQPATLYSPALPQLPHAQSAPQPSTMAPYMYQPHNPQPSYAMSMTSHRVSEFNAAHGQFGDQFTESKRRLTGSGGHSG